MSGFFLVLGGDREHGNVDAVVLVLCEEMKTLLSTSIIIMIKTMIIIVAAVVVVVNIYINDQFIS